MSLVTRISAIVLFLAATASAQVVISQVNGNGGLSVTGADPFDRDFVELFNKGSTPVNLAGWSLQIWGDSGTASDAATPAWDVIPLSGTILPGQYFLIMNSLQRGLQSSSVTTSPLPPADLLGSAYDQSMLVSAVNAVALMSTTMQIPAGQCPSGPNLVDFFRHAHPNGLCFEVAAAPPNTSGGGGGVFRNGGGCDDTNNNLADLISNQTPDPRNSDTNVFVTTLASPNVLESGTGGLVTLTAVSGSSPCNPLGTLTAATANLSAFGLGAAVAMFDDGAHGDGGNSDGTFGIQFTVPASQAVGIYVIPMTGTSGATTLASSARLRVFPTPASNDPCANPIDLNGVGVDIVNNGPYSTFVNTLNATSDGIDAGSSGTSCNGDSEVKFSIWYSFTAPAPGALRISEASSEDVVYSIHPSCGGASMQCIQREDGAFSVAGATNYLIQIGRETASTVTPQVYLELTFEYLPTSTTIPNDLPCDAQPISSFPFAAQPWAPAATDETGAFNISCDAAANVSARNGVWYSFVAPANGILVTFENSNNLTNFTLYTGPDCNSLGSPDCKDESTSAGAQHLGLIEGTTYWLLVSYDSAVTTNTPNQPYDFSTDFIAIPINDTCTGAVNLNAVGLPYATLAPGHAATVDLGVPTATGTGTFNPCNATLGNRPNGVWYVYSTGPSANGTLRIADSSSSDLFYNVFTGSCEGLTPNQCYGASTNDDIYIALSPNTTYYILVGMQSTTATATSAYDLSFTLHPTPANDEPCGATDINTPSFSTIVVGASATADVDLSCNFSGQSTTGYGVWYHFNVPTAKQLEVHDSTSEDLVFGLFTGPDCGNLTESKCLMGGGSGTDDAYFELSPGTDYWLLIGRIANSQPIVAFTLEFELTDANGACCTPGACSIATAATCTGAFVGPFTYCGESPSYEETPNAGIPDGTPTTGGTPGVLTRTIEVNDAGTATVQDLKVLIQMNHARLGDLIITLQSPEGNSMELVRRLDDDDDTTCPSYGQQGRLTDLGATYIFDDQSYNPFGPDMHRAGKYFDFTGLVVPSGHYTPALCNGTIPTINSVFNGTAINGTWTLTITDNQNSSTGTLNRWGLIINYGLDNPCTCPVDGDADGNGQLNGLDIDPFVDCLIAGGSCDCADMTSDGNVTLDDVTPFVNALTQ